MARRQLFTAEKVGSLLEDEEFVCSGSDDDFDTGLDEELDPIDREQGNLGTI